MINSVKAEVFPRPVFDHCYRTIDGDHVFKSFATRGFFLNPDPVIHPGRLKCQFLHFMSPDNTHAYLEFLFRDETLQESSNSPEEELLHAGFAMKVANDLRQTFERYERIHAGLQPNFEHRNYERTCDESARLPGWNFLTFMNQPIHDIEVWLIEYEQIPTRTEEQIRTRRQQFIKMCEHPNTARRILGFLWKGQNPDHFSKFAELASADASDQKLSLEGGTSVRIVSESDPAFRHFANKNGTFLGVVIGVESLEMFIKEAKPDDVFELYGRKVARISLENASWDIVAIEGSVF